MLISYKWSFAAISFYFYQEMAAEYHLLKISIKSPRTPFDEQYSYAILL